jgi:hypothetical protein
MPSVSTIADRSLGRGQPDLTTPRLHLAGEHLLLDVPSPEEAVVPHRPPGFWRVAEKRTFDQSM